MTCSIEDCHHVASLHQGALKLLNQNIRSINRNFDGLTTLLERSGTTWDLIILTECWLLHSPPIPVMQGYNLAATSRHRTQNEGVIVYSRTQLQIYFKEPEIHDANCLALTINKDTVVIAIYRPPAQQNFTLFLESLNELLKSYSSYKNIVLAGDINIDISEKNIDSRSHDYLTLLTYHGMLPAHELPTRLNRSCLDHIILKSKNHACCLVADTSLTDHDTTLLFLHTSSQYNNLTQNNKTRKFIDYDKINEKLLQIDFSLLYNSTDANVATNYFINTLNTIILENTSLKVVPHRKRLRKLWMTPGLLRCLRNRDKLHKKVKKYPNNEVLQLTFKRYRNYCTSLLKSAKSNYDRAQIKNAQNNNKKLWETIKTITHTKKQNTHANDLLTHAGPANSINTVNHYFANVGSSLALNIHAKKTHSKVPILFSHLRTFAMLETDQSEIETLINSLRTDCATGSDNISGIILKKFKHILLAPVTFLCNLAISTGVFPDVFKLAVVHPIYKGTGDRRLPNNYRPISILPTLSKILEKIMNHRLIKFLDKYNLLSPSQYGFRSGISTSDAVLNLTNEIVTKLDKKNKVIGIFLDLAKAFDTISIPTLITKLEAVGLRGNQLSLFRSYLTGRRQCVKISDLISDELPIAYGVPQGSILGPTLFLIYINDLCQLNITNGSIYTYADDTALVFHGSSWEAAFSFAQCGLNTVTDWLSKNLLTLNVDKTKYVTFSLSTRGKISSSPFSLIAHSCNPLGQTACGCPSLARTNCIRYLGIQIDDLLSFHSHIDVLSSRLRKLTYIFKNLRHVTDRNVLTLVYLALCQSVTQYCIVAWGGSSKTHFLKLERAQRCILKVGWRLPYRFPTNDLYKTCKVLSVRKLFILNLIMTTHSKTPYDPTLLVSQRRGHGVRPTTLVSTSLAQRFYGFLSSFIYNKINKLINIYPMTQTQCKHALTNWLHDLDYEQTENLLQTVK